MVEGAQALAASALAQLRGQIERVTAEAGAVQAAVAALEAGGAAEVDLRLGVGRQRLHGLEAERRQLEDRLAQAEVSP
jgi:hypothetical protein